MAFDWPSFLNAHGIAYVDRGPSTAKNNIYVPCPFCGDADQGHHMGISLENRGWGCWRNKAHRGRAPQRLIQALVGCSWAEADRWMGRSHGALEADAGLAGLVATALGAPAKNARQRPPLRLPKAAKALTDHFIEPAEAYLFDDRGYSEHEINVMVARFHLHFAMTGDWAYRILFPVHDEDSALVTWTGRAINATAAIRYKTLTHDPEKAGDGPCAHGPINDYLLGLPDLLLGAHLLVITEGPFDAALLSVYAEDFDAKVTCLFGKVLTDAQLDWLVRLRPFYDRMVFLLDPDAALDNLALQRQTAILGASFVALDGSNDPGEMRRAEITGLFESLVGAGVRRWPTYGVAPSGNH